MSKPPTWSPADLRDLESLAFQRDKKGRLPWATMTNRFPSRTKTAILDKMADMGWNESRRWTPEEDKILKSEWGEVTSRTLAKLLPGRSHQSRYDRARKLGLRAGAPQGMVSVRSLVDDPKWGYDYYTTLRILKTSGVPVKTRNYGSDRANSRGRRYVDPDDAREAAETWERQRAQTETVSQAAHRLRMANHTLWRWLTEDSLVPPCEDGVARSFRAAPDVFDRVNEKYRQRRPPSVEATPPAPKPQPIREDVKRAAARLHLKPQTLRKWLQMEGLVPPVCPGTRVVLRMEPEMFDRVAEKYRTGKNASKGPRTRQPLDAEDTPAASSSTRMAGALPATMTPPPA